MFLQTFPPPRFLAGTPFPHLVSSPRIRGSMCSKSFPSFLLRLKKFPRFLNSWSTPTTSSRIHPPRICLWESSAGGLSYYSVPPPPGSKEVFPWGFTSYLGVGALSPLPLIPWMYQMELFIGIGASPTPQSNPCAQPSLLQCLPSTAPIPFSLIPLS